jgi:hypothetical protein
MTPAQTPLVVQGFALQPPDGFEVEEMTVALRMGAGSTPAPSLIVQSKPARAGATLGDLASETFAELVQTVPKMSKASRSEFTFADGASGIVIAYNFTAQTGELRQYFVLRLDRGRLCAVTLTVPTQALNETNATAFMAAIASVRPS